MAAFKPRAEHNGEPSAQGKGASDNSDTEAAIICTVIEHDGEPLPPNLARLIDFAPESFDDQRWGNIAVGIRDSKRFDTLSLIGHRALPLGLAESDAAALWERFNGRNLASLFGDALEALQSNPGRAASIESHVRAALQRTDVAPSIDLEKRRFNPSIVPPTLRPVYTLREHVIATPGNLVAITSAAKTGKTAVIGAMLSSVLTKDEEADLLGFYSRNPKEFALLHFDSEQSPDDHWHQANRALKRAGLSQPPAWFYSYCLTGLGAKQSWKSVLDVTRVSAERHGGVHSILIDGAADLVLDVNDPAESNQFVAELHDMAIQNDCPIITVIHFNPGGDKVRGHLGSQLERKAETNLRLDKEDGVTIVWSDKQRRAPIPKSSGLCFQWSSAAGMHITVLNRLESREELEKKILSAQAEDVFTGRPSMHWSDLKTTLMDKLGVSKNTAERRIKEMHRLEIIKQSIAGLYVLNT